jgi:MoxR-like ATPase
VESFYDYVIWGPIGRAFRTDKKVVLLLDEVDKTESDVQDNLLDILEDCQFTIREVNDTIKAKIRPAIFITSNAKRELSDPFLRRCYCHHIAFPSRDDMKQIVNLHYPQTSPKLLEAAINIFYELRERGFEKPPATSELLDWIGALEATGQMPTREMPPLTGALLKRAGDILRYRGGGAGKTRGSNY